MKGNNMYLARVLSVAVAVAVAMSASLVAAGNAAAREPSQAGVVADFEGRRIDLAEGWGEAQACAVTPEWVRCFRTEPEMDAALLERREGQHAIASPLATCSSSLRLYDETNYGVPVVSFTTTGSLIVLGSHGFDNKTSSYRIGACAAKLYDGIGTTQYPGNTNAGASAATMQSGWNNTISSVLMP